MNNSVLNVSLEDGSIALVNVLNIIDSLEFNKTFLIYTVNENKENVFASILNETEDSYSLDKIESDKEIDYINKEINKVVNNLKEGD